MTTEIPEESGNGNHSLHTFTIISPFDTSESPSEFENVQIERGMELGRISLGCDEDDVDADLEKNQEQKNSKYLFLRQRFMLVPYAIVLVFLFYGIVYGISMAVIKRAEKVEKFGDASFSEDLQLSSYESLSPSASSSQLPSTFSLERTADLVKEFSIAGGSFGYSVSLSESGDHLAVGSPRNGNGRVQLYQKTSTDEWIEYGEVFDDQINMILFGFSVELLADGKKLSVRALREGSFLGGVHVFLYEYTGNFLPWKPIGFWAMDAHDITKSSSAFSSDGYTLAIGQSGNRYGGQLVVYRDRLKYSFEMEDSTTMTDTSIALSGDGTRFGYLDGMRVYVAQFEARNLLNGEWKQLGDPIPGSDNDYGTAVILSDDGNFLIIASTKIAKVYRFDENTRQWEQFGNEISDEYSVLPSSVCVTFLSDSRGEIDVYRVALSSMQTKEQNDVIRIYEYQSESASWVRIAMIDGQNYADGFGASISLSGDGKNVVVGSPTYDDISDELFGQALLYKIGS